MPPSPIGSIRSLNSRYLNGDWHDIRDDDILGKFDNSDLEIEHPGE